MKNDIKKGSDLLQDEEKYYVEIKHPRMKGKFITYSGLSKEQLKKMEKKFDIERVMTMYHHDKAYRKNPESKKSKNYIDYAIDRLIEVNQHENPFHKDDFNGRILQRAIIVIKKSKNPNNIIIEVLRAPVSFKRGEETEIKKEEKEKFLEKLYHSLYPIQVFDYFLIENLPEKNNPIDKKSVEDKLHLNIVRILRSLSGNELANFLIFSYPGMKKSDFDFYRKYENAKEHYTDSLQLDGAKETRADLSKKYEIFKNKEVKNPSKGNFSGLARALQLAVDKYYTTGKRADYKQAVLIQAEFVRKFKDNKPYVKEVIKKLAAIYKNVKPGKIDNKTVTASVYHFGKYNDETDLKISEIKKMNKLTGDQILTLNIIKSDAKKDFYAYPDDIDEDNESIGIDYAYAITPVKKKK